MSTLDEIASNIEEDLDRTDLTARIHLEINRAIRHYRDKHFFFNEAISTFVTVDGTKEYSSQLPSNLLHIDLLQIRVSGNDEVVCPKSYQWVKGVDSNNYTGYPEYYAYYDESVHFYPVPNQSFTATVSYTFGVDDLPSGGASNVFTDNAQELIEARVNKRINMLVIRDSEAANQAAQLEQEALDSLLKRTANRNSPAKLSFRL